ncbi:MAG: GH32 C-terminal domain-containing protein [Clostridia bacterium]|nr:GH32 C-terminal domain-containing protein [Clostridia bacterium]
MLDVFIDKCVLEVFVNGKRSLIQSVYPSRDARGVCLSSIRGDAEILSLDMWEMKSYGEE